VRGAHADGDRLTVAQLDASCSRIAERHPCG